MSRLHLIASLLVLAVTSTAGATPPDVFGYGPRTQGMGNTGVAFASNYEAVFHNPAGLAAQRRAGFTLGLQAGSFELELDGQQWPLDAYSGTTLGFHIPLPFGGVLEDTFVIGAGFYTPTSTVLRTDIIFPEVPNFVLLARTQSVHVMLGLGVNLDRLIPGLRLGLGVATLADIGGRLLVGLDGGNQFFSQTETQLLAGFHPIVGLHLDLPGDLTIGAVYRNKVQSDIDLAIRAENLLPGELELPIITITAIPQFDPHTVALEGAWRPTSDWLLSLQLQYQHWSTYPGVVGKTTSNSDLPPHPGFRNTVTPRLGVEWEGQHRRTTAQLRGGYAFVPTPARPARLATKRDSEGEDLIRPGGDPVQQPLRYLDNHRHMMSLGGSIIWESSSGAHVQFDLFTQLHYLMPRTHDIPAEGTEGPGLETRGWILTAGWGVVFEW